MSNTNNNTNTTRTANDGPESYVFYTPPTTPEGDRDIRKEVEIWRSKRVANRSIENYPLDALILIDSLVAAIEEERKKRKDAEEQAERWEDDALRLMNERNDAEKRIDNALALLNDAKREAERDTLLNNFNAQFEAPRNDRTA